jgi:hypothetical protein
VNEKIIEECLRNQIKVLGGKAYKFVSPGNTGVPDRLVCLPGGRVIFVELKAPGKKATPLQQKKHLELIKLGQQVFVIDNKFEVDRFIDYCKGLIRQ